jgi:hypothetical protein
MPPPRSTGPAQQPATARSTAVRLAVAYWWLQAALVALWWLGLILWPAWRQPFRPSASPEVDLLAFAVPDLALLVAGSWAAGFATRRAAAGAPWAAHVAVAAAWLTAGAAAYATLFCVGWLWLTGEPWPAVLAMLPAAVGSVVAAVLVQSALRQRGGAEPRR